MNIINELHKKFKDIFHTENKKIYFSPGRVNLIGEHIDYNGGLVFPCAINLGTYGGVSFNNKKVIRAYSLNFENVGLIEIPLDNLIYNKTNNWANYLIGVVKFMKEAGHSIDKGFDLLIYGNLPNGAGLSSSASLEILCGKILIDLFKIDMTRVELALLGKQVENKFIGVNSGIMDQFAISLGKKDNAIELDCNTLNYLYAPLRFKNQSIVIMNTNKRRELADSKYNERRAECESALEHLQKVKNIKTLCELSIEEFNEISPCIESLVEKNRAFHAITENQRVKNAMVALNNEDLNVFGQLMTDSHISLRDNYEVTGIELDTLVLSALNQEGVLGSRMTGAGFGGCAIALVENNHIDKFIKNVGDQYKKTIGYEADFYIASTADGPTEIF